MSELYPSAVCSVGKPWTRVATRAPTENIHCIVLTASTFKGRVSSGKSKTAILLQMRRWDLRSRSIFFTNGNTYYRLSFK